MKTSELTGVALDWAVAVAEEYTANIRTDEYKQWQDLGRTQVHDDDYTYWNPSTDWAQGGPIIGREGIAVCTQMTRFDWQAIDFHGDITQFGPTPLIAAMRCYVQSKLGDEVETPEELS